MKTNINENYGLVSLSADDLTSVNGGSFWETLGYVIGVTAKTIYVLVKLRRNINHLFPQILKNK